MSKKLYVGNLNYEVTEDELNQLFGQCGQVAEVRIVKDRDTNRFLKGLEFKNTDPRNILYRNLLKWTLYCVSFIVAMNNSVIFLKIEKRTV